MGGFADACIHRAASYEKQGQLKLAFVDYEQYFVGFPDAPDRAQVAAQMSAVRR